ncbi:MAG: electron transport complex subunit RsxA [Gammaproteobacteria bacterium]|nr:electron transport complex subunit RsxA [Gammaproteobacteria bacterium]
MTDFLLIVVAAATINNIVLERLLGLCPVLGQTQGMSSRVDNAGRSGLATTCALTITAGLSHLLYQWLLLPRGLVYLRTIGLLALSALTVQGVNVLLERHGAGQGPFASQHLPLTTMNCAVLGVALLTTGTADTLGDAIALGLGAGLGFTVVVMLFASLRPRLEQSPVPAPLRGPAVALITVGMMSLAFLGFSGLGT